MSGLAKTLYVTLGVLTVVTVVVSLQPSVALRQVRNLTILASYVVGIALLFSDRWIRPASIWAGVGLLSGLLYFGYETWSVSKARRERPAEDHGQPRASTVLLGVVGWPIALPEVIESTLADLGVIGSAPPAPKETAPKRE